MANPSENLPGPPVSTPEAAPIPGLGSMRKISPRPGAAPIHKGRRGKSVRLLKFALPLVVFVTLGYVGYWWLQSRGNIVDPALLQGGPNDTGQTSEGTVQEVKYEGKGDKGRRFSITADSASHVDGDDRHSSLKKPLADITMANGAYVALMANDGMLDRDADIITLNGDVTLFHDNGLSFQ